MKRSLRARLGYWVAAAVLAAVAATAPAAAQQPVVFDETVIRVNGELILKSDILWNLALTPDATVPEFWQSDVQERMLRTLVDQRLLLQEAAKLPATQVTDDEITQEIEQLKTTFLNLEDPARLELRAEAVGLTMERLREIVRQRLRILKFVDFRFRSFVIVTEPEIVDYYENDFKPDNPGVLLDAVRDQIERLLIEEKINNSIDSFLEDSRARADIVRLDE